MTQVPRLLGLNRLAAAITDGHPCRHLACELFAQVTMGDPVTLPLMRILHKPFSPLLRRLDLARFRSASSQLGHSRKSLTLDTYAHVLLDD